MKKLLTILLVVLLAFPLASCSAKVKSVDEMEYTLSFLGNEYSGLYTGETVKKIPNGNGTFKSSDAEWIISGIFTEGMVESATVTNFPLPLLDSTKFTDGTYSGDITVDGISGNGFFSSTTVTIPMWDGSTRTGIYDGEVNEGIPCGNGKLLTKGATGSPYTYEGAFDKGTFNGYGVLIFDESGQREVGDFIDGQYVPSVADFYEFWGSVAVFGDYSIAQDTRDFIESHSEMFPSYDASIFTEMELGEYNYKQYNKNITGYTDKLVKFKGKIMQVFEDTDVYGYTVTSALIYDSDYNYSVVYLLGSYDIFDGDKVTVYGIPTSPSSFPNVGGGTTTVIVFLAPYISK